MLMDRLVIAVAAGSLAMSAFVACIDRAVGSSAWITAMTWDNNMDRFRIRQFGGQVAFEVHDGSDWIQLAELPAPHDLSEVLVYFGAAAPNGVLEAKQVQFAGVND